MLCSGSDGAYQGDCGHAVLARGSRHAHAGLARCGLSVDLSFAGQAKIAATDALIEPNSVKNGVDAGCDCGPGERDQPTAKTASRAGSLERFDIHFEIAPHQRGQVGEPFIEQNKLLAGGAFLRSIDKCCTVGSGQWIAHVASNDQFNVVECR